MLANQSPAEGVLWAEGISDFLPACQGYESHLVKKATAWDRRSITKLTGLFDANPVAGPQSVPESMQKWMAKPVN